MGLPTLTRPGRSGTGTGSARTTDRTTDKADRAPGPRRPVRLRADTVAILSLIHI